MQYLAVFNSNNLIIPKINIFLTTEIFKELIIKATNNYLIL